MNNNSLESRFLQKINKTNGCWIWIGAKHGCGYGAMKANGRQVDAHRLSWEIHNGPIPANTQVLHRCDVRGCVNPKHLFLGTQRDNVLDAVNKGRHGKTILLEQDVRVIRKSKESNVVLARKYGVHWMTIYYARTGRSWEHLQ
jgi:HNH endonuclease